VNRSRLIAGEGTPARAWREDPELASARPIDAGELAQLGSRLVVVAPHPDDEVLTAGGLLQLLAQRGHALLLVAVTDGEGSHAGSPEWPPERLVTVRPRESAEALACLGIERPELLRLGIADGGVAAAEAALASRLAALLAPGDVVVTTWRYDGHPDHEATARACLARGGAEGRARARGSSLGLALECAGRRRHPDV
jgi:LmbE family N-acetylglucosaminyl deacetylase